MPTITVIGDASQQTLLSCEIPKDSPTLLDFLRSKNIPIASSCDGEGICKKCKFNTNTLACQVTLEESSADLEIHLSYL
jgi:ferredoxin